MKDKDIRKQIRNELRVRAREKFESNLPMTREKFKALFNSLDFALQEEGCNDDLVLTTRYLTSIGLSNIDDIVLFLNDHGGFCDCEVLANVEEQFD